MQSLGEHLLLQEKAFDICLMHECRGTECQSLEKKFHISTEIDSTVYVDANFVQGYDLSLALYECHTAPSFQTCQQVLGAHFC